MRYSLLSSLVDYEAKHSGHIVIAHVPVHVFSCNQSALIFHILIKGNFVTQQHVFVANQFITRFYLHNCLSNDQKG